MSRFNHAELLGLATCRQVKVVDHWLNRFVAASSNRFETVRTRVFIMSVFLMAILAAPRLFSYGLEGRIFYTGHLLLALSLLLLPKRTEKIPLLMDVFSGFILLESFCLLQRAEGALAGAFFWAPAIIAMFTIFHGSRKALIPCSLYVLQMLWFGLKLSRSSSFRFDSIPKEQLDSMVMTLLCSQAFLVGIILTFEQAKLKAEKDLKVEYEKRLEARRMAFVRELIGNVAHEINNPLAIIQASVIRLERAGFAKGSREYLELIGNIEGAANRVCAVRDGLGHFAVGDSKEKLEAIDVRSLFKQAIQQSKAYKSYSQLVFSDRSQGLQILCRQRQIGTALNELILNAHEAIDNAENGRILVEAYLESQNLCFCVTDNGRGIPEEMRDKIFLPFVSTHAREGKRGLGLSVSRGTIAEHGGHIDFENDGGKTRFTIRLPLNLANQVSRLRERRLS